MTAFAAKLSTPIASPEIPMTRREVRRIVLFTMCAAAALLVVIFAIIGCRGGVKLAHDPRPVLDSADRTVQSIIPQSQQIEKHAGEIERITPKKSLPAVLRETVSISRLAEFIREKATMASTDLSAAREQVEGLKAAVTAANDRADGLAKELDLEQRAHVKTIADFNGRWYVVWGRRIDAVLNWAFYGLIAAAVGGLGLRIAANVIGGAWGGTILATAGSALLHLVPWAGGLLNQFFDNYHFRDRVAGTG